LRLLLLLLADFDDALEAVGASIQLLCYMQKPPSGLTRPQIATCQTASLLAIGRHIEQRVGGPSADAFFQAEHLWEHVQYTTGHHMSGAQLQALYGVVKQRAEAAWERARQDGGSADMPAGSLLVQMPGLPHELAGLRGARARQEEEEEASRAVCAQMLRRAQQDRLQAERITLGEVRVAWLEEELSEEVPEEGPYSVTPHSRCWQGMALFTLCVLFVLCRLFS
jgi:hypothetical protein